MDKYPSEQTDSNRQRITVDISKLAHCDWCGTVESKEWRQYMWSGSFCSNDCLRAGKFHSILGSSFLLLMLPITLSFVGLPIPQAMNSEYVFYLGMLFLTIYPFGVFGLYNAWKGANTRQTIPQSSRAPVSSQ